MSSPVDRYRCGNTIHSDYVTDHRCKLQKNHGGDCSFGSNDPQRDLEVARLTVQWIKIKQQFEERYDPLQGPTRADVDHSALLQRLLSGKEPLPVPPPKQHSYPAYSLVENDGPQYVHEVWFPPADGEVVIEQSRWKIECINGREDYNVYWDHDQRYRLYKKDNVKVGFGWDKVKEGPPRDIYERAWVLEKI